MNTKVLQQIYIYLFQRISLYNFSQKDFQGLKGS